MEKAVSFFFVIASFGLLVSCSTPNYRVASTPSEAETDLVYKNGTRRALGKTPISVNARDANPMHEAFQIEVRKEGFDKQTVYVPESAFDKNLDLAITLSPGTQANTTKNMDANFNEIASAVADIQHDIQTKNFEVALNKTTRMISSYPTVSTFYSLAGNIHYLEKRLDRARASYKKALDLNPGSIELAKIIEKIDAVTTGGSR